MKIRKLLQLSSAFVLSLSSLLTLSIPLVHAAGPYTCTWTGAGTDAHFSTAANWSGCNSAAPVAGDGDNLVFPADSLTLTRADASNDLTSATFASITIQGTGTQSVTIEGNSFTLTGGISDSNGPDSGDYIENPITLSGNQTINLTNKAEVSLDGVITGSANLSQTGNGALGLSGNNTSYTGAITVSGGDLVGESSNAIGTSSAPGATINDGADFILFPSLSNLFTNCQLFDFNGNLNLTGNSSVSVGDISQLEPKFGNGEVCDAFGAFGGNEAYGSPSQAGNVNLTGTITLGTDITFAGIPDTTTITGALSGSHTITMLPGYLGKLVVNSSNNTSSLANGTYTSGTNVETLSDSQPSTFIDIYGNNVITIDGVREGVAVHDGGILKGNGSAGALTVDQGGTVAPGHSPGCLNTGDLALSGTYQAEIGGTTACTGYDQLNVTGTVDLTGSTLSASIVNGFAPTAGQSFTIINNDGNDAVTGTFTNLPEGATFSANGVTFSVTYKGGDGNDVVLTDVGGAVPAKPNTGMRLVAAHPGISMAITVLSAGSLLYVARRQKLSTKR